VVIAEESESIVDEAQTGAERIGEEGVGVGGGRKCGLVDPHEGHEGCVIESQFKPAHNLDRSRICRLGNRRLPHRSQNQGKGLRSLYGRIEVRRQRFQPQKRAPYSLYQGEEGSVFRLLPIQGAIGIEHR
jgi:hypothetical protein